MKCKQLPMICVLGATLLGGGMASALAHDFDITLEGFQEVPVVSTTGRGYFGLRHEMPYRYELEYDDLEGVIVKVHIHLGQAGVNGGVMAWLCANPRFVNRGDIYPPRGTPPCRGTSGHVSGELTAADAVGPIGQGVEPGEGREALAAIRAGVAYVNVHTDHFPGGEIRGQIKHGDSYNGGGEIEALREDLYELRDDFEDHTHAYRTGRGNGHNNTEAITSRPE